MTTSGDPFDLAGHVALVTGGSSGLGRRIGLALARAGAAVVLVARRAELLEEASGEIEAVGARAACLVADVGDTSAIDGMAEDAARPFGAPDILVNAAGVNLRQPPAEVTIDSWNRTLSLNLTAPFFLARALLPGMKARRWGKIVNLASLQSCRAFANGIAYGASKGGIVQLTRAMAEAWSRFGITCNALAPGFFPTELTAPLFGDPATLEKLAAQTAIGRNGELSDIDGPAVFLAAPASDYITGQVIFVDGGFTAK
ncbi:MAG: SDR family oxidoreductase [Rhodospirillales bacterium]|nr:MAG: SDR family oxidoreductase [Rhodospirillales bacterium]